MKGKNYNIEIARPEEAPVITNLFISARKGMVYLPEIHTNAETLDYISSLVNQGKIYVLKNNKTIVGLMMVGEGYLHHLYIDPAYHGKGYGKMLLDKAKELFPEGMYLWVFEQNLGAIKFYEREGFRLLEKRDREHADNEEGLADRKYFWKKFI